MAQSCQEHRIKCICLAFGRNRIIYSSKSSNFSWSDDVSLLCLLYSYKHDDHQFDKLKDQYDKLLKHEQNRKNENETLKKNLIKYKRKRLI